MKYCPCCKIKKEYNKFNKNKARRDGVDVYCILCRKEKQKCKQEQKKQKRLKDQFIHGETWKDITEFNGYECSTEGRIRNKTTYKLLNPSIQCSGYAVSSIRGKNIRFHRIITQTFLPNFQDKPTVEHKDDNKLNNRLYNLKWATFKEQQQYVKDKKSRNSQLGVKIGTNDMTNLEGESWKIITEYPEYEISNIGRIKYPIRKGTKPYKKRITYGGSSSDGYKTFELRNINGKKKIAIHRLVAKEFVSNPNNYVIVNHKDGDKKNNNFKNLEFCTRSHNTQHAYDNDLISGKRKIYQLDINNNIIKEWDTIKDAYEKLKLSRTAINSVLSGRNKTSGGYYWCYKEEYDKSKKKFNMYDTNKIKIKQFDRETNKLIKIWNSTSEAAEFIAKENKSSFKAIKSNISQCIRKKRNSCQGFKWEYC
jgi:hypothetical protein